MHKSYNFTRPNAVVKIRCQLAGTKVPQTMSLILKYATDITNYNHAIIHTFLLTFRLFRTRKLFYKIYYIVYYDPRPEK